MRLLPIHSAKNLSSWSLHCWQRLIHASLSEFGVPKRSPEEAMGSTLTRREGCNWRSEVSLFSPSWQLKLNKNWASSPALNGFQFSFPLLVLFPLCPHPHQKEAQVSGVLRQIIIGSWSKGLKYFLHFCVSYTASEMWGWEGESESRVQCAAVLLNASSHCSGVHWPQSSHRGQCWALTISYFLFLMMEQDSKILARLNATPSHFTFPKTPPGSVCVRVVEQKLKRGSSCPCSSLDFSEGSISDSYLESLLLTCWN